MAGPVWAHLAIVTAESIRCALGPWPQLTGEVVTAGISAVLQGRAQKARHQSGLGLGPDPNRPLEPEPEASAWRVRARAGQPACCPRRQAGGERGSGGLETADEPG